MMGILGYLRSEWRWKNLVFESYSARLLLLDEPTASVDVGSREQIYHLLEELNKSMTIILVTHDLLAVSLSWRRSLS